MQIPFPIAFAMPTPVKWPQEVKFMHIFRRPHYESEITRFIQKMRDEKPSLEAGQLAGRALLWDKNVDRSAWAEYREARVPQQAYVYRPIPDTLPTNPPRVNP